jgi:hypothetical protein
MGRQGDWESRTDAKVPASADIAARLGIAEGDLCVPTEYEFLPTVGLCSCRRAGSRMTSLEQPEPRQAMAEEASLLGIQKAALHAHPADVLQRPRSPRGESMRNERHEERLSDEELELFLQYLHRFANHDLDLFALMEVGDPGYPAYLSFSRSPLPGTDASAYRRP